MSISSKQNVVVLNSSHYLPTGSGNKFVYPFRPGFNFSSNDKIGVQSLSIFNSFYNISAAYANNTFKFSFPCFNPSGANSAVFVGSIGNAVQFNGQISNPVNIEINGGTITSTSTFAGFIAGAKTSVTGYISGNLLRITSGSPVFPTGTIYINGSSTYIISGSNSLGYTLSDSALSPLGSAASPSSAIFGTPAGNILYATTAPTAALSGTIYITATGVASQTLATTNILTSAGSSYALTSTSNIYIASRAFTAGVGSNTFVGFSDGTIYNGMQFYTDQTYTITSNILSGSQYSLTLDKVAGIFPNTTVQNVGIPQNSFSILTVSGDTNGSGIYFPNVSMKLSGSGVLPNVSVLSQISSAGALTGQAGVYKISYSPNTPVQQFSVNDGNTSNTTLYVSSIQSGAVIPGMTFEVNGLYIFIENIKNTNINGTGTYTISTPSASIPSMYPTTISASTSFGTSVDLNITIPDGYYTADSLNYFLQNICIQNNLYLTDSAGSGVNTYFCEILQNSTYYGFQLNLYNLPNKMPQSLSYPQGAIWTLLNDNNTYTPQIIFPPSLQKFFGFSSNIVNKTSGKITIDPTSLNMLIPTSTTSLQSSNPNIFLNNMQNIVSTYTFVSDICPIIHTVNSLVMDCNLICSKYNAERSNTFFSIPMSAPFGNLITVGPVSPCLCNMAGGNYTAIEISFYDTYGAPVNVRDSDITLTLVLSVEQDIPPFPNLRIM